MLCLCLNVFLHQGHLYFFVQCFSLGGHVVRDTVLSGLQDAANTELALTPLSAEHYVHRLMRSDLAVLPYDPAAYRNISSGILADAVGFGVPVVVPKGTWSGHVLDQGYGAGVQFEQWTAHIIADAILSSTDSLDELKKAARGSITRWQSEQSIDAYLDRLLESINFTAAPTTE